VAIAYQDNGRFFVKVISTAGEELDHFDVSKHLVIDDQSKPITGFWEPLITSVFIPGEGGQDLFITAYHRTERKQYNFTYSFREKKVLSGTTVSEITKNCTLINFPLKSFYSAVTNNVYTFYRQGHGFTFNVQDPSQVKMELITTADLGSMYLLFD
jgi:hypothetical protein